MIVRLPRLPALSLFAFGTLAACGGGSPPPAPTTPAPLPVATGQASTPKIDVSPVPEPEGLVAIGRVAKPEAIVKTVGTWTRLPLPGGSELVRSITDDAVGSAVDLSQPVDAAVVLAGGRGSPKPLWAFSVAVRSFDDAKSKLSSRHRLTPRANGAFEIEGIGRDDAIGGDRGGGEEDDGDENGCVLAHASSGARIVCGEPAAVESLTPYLTRTLPRQSFPDDLHLELRFGPVRQPVADLRAQLPILARGLLGSQSQAVRELVDAAIGEIADIVADTNRIQFDGRIEDAGITANTRIEYGGAKSLLTQLAIANADKAGAPPPAFWHLPQETDVAFFGKGSDPKMTQHARELLANLLLETFAEGGMPDAERKTVKDLVTARMLPLFTGPAVYAKGYDQAAVEKAMAARKTVKPSDVSAVDEADRALGEQIVGWHLLQVSEPVANVGPILKDWSSLWARPGFTTWAKKHASAKMLARLRVAPPPAGVTLPKETVHLEITIPREDLEQHGPVNPGAKQAKPKKIARKPLVAHVLAVPDAGSTWIAFGLDGKLVAQKAAAALSSAPEQATLGKSAGYEALRDAKITGALTLALRGLLVFTAVDRNNSPFNMVSSLPNKGGTPVTMTFAAEKGSGGAQAGAATSTLRIPRGTIEDVVRLVMSSH